MSVIIRDSIITNGDTNFAYTFPAHSVTAMELVKEFGITENNVVYCSQLYENVPNPFNKTVLIRYSIAEFGQTGLEIYNLVGQLVKTLVNREQKAGNYLVSWDGRDENKKLMPSGIYFVKLSTKGGSRLLSGKAGEFSQTKKLLFLR